MVVVRGNPVPIPPYLTCYAYVDGQYIRAELRDMGVSDEFDPRIPAGLVVAERIGRTVPVLTRTFYYDAVDTQAPPADQDRQRAYLDKLQLLPDVHVVRGEVARGGRREQKGVDVQLAVDALRAAAAGNVQMIAILSGDGDFAPLARAIRETGPHVVVIAFPRSLSTSLRQEADRFIAFDQPPPAWAIPG